MPDRFRLAQVDKKTHQQVADILVNAFADEVVQVTVSLLRAIHCNHTANELEEATQQPAAIYNRMRAQSRSQSAREHGEPQAPRWDSAPGGPSSATSADNKGHFVDRHRVELIERVSYMAPILDRLLQEGVLHQEQYDRAMEIRTTQAQMRFLFSGPLRSGGDSSKEVFMSALCVYEPYLVQDLWKTEG